MQQQPRIQECWDRDLELLISVFKCNYPVQTMTFWRITWDRRWHDAISVTLSCMLSIKWWTPNKSLARWCCHFIVSQWYPYLLHGTYQDKCLLPVDCKTSPKKHTTLTKRTWIWGMKKRKVLGFFHMIQHCSMYQRVFNFWKPSAI